MHEVEERAIGDEIIRIDRTRCVGSGHCTTEAPATFTPDADGLASFAEPMSSTRDHLIRACELCPVAALSLLDGKGSQLVP